MCIPSTGKSTTIKSECRSNILSVVLTSVLDFQRKLAPQLWDSERPSWRAVIFLNLVHSVNAILGLLVDEMPNSGTTSPTGFTSNHKLLKLRLGPLHHIQNDLESLLGSPSICEPLSSSIDHHNPSSASGMIPRHHEFWIISNHGWKSALDRVRGQPANLNDHNYNNGETRRQRTPRRGITSTEEVAEVIASCAADIKALWADTIVQNMLKKHELILEDWAVLQVLYNSAYHLLI